MQGNRKSITVPVLVSALLLFAVLGYQTLANRSAPKAPSMIATIDLERVFELLDARADADQRLEAMGASLDEQMAERRKAIEQMDRELDALPKGSQQYRQLEDRYTEAAVQYQAWVEFQRQRVDREKALAKVEIYNQVKEALKSLAEERGYDVVLLNDSLREVQPASDAAVTSQISARRMLYTNPMLDITEDLVTRMNNARKAARVGN